MNKTRIVFSLIGVLMVFSVGFVGTMAYAIPDHVDLPTHAIDNAHIFKPTIIRNNGYEAIIQPVVTTYSNPDNFVTSDPTQAKLLLQRIDGSVGCSGTLIDDIHVLTAGHCVANSIGAPYLSTSLTSYANFSTNQLAEPQLQYEIIDVNIHPQYDGKIEKGYDIAIVTLDQPVDTIIPRIPVDATPADDLNNDITIRSFGVSGYGHEGSRCIENNPCQEGDTREYPFGIDRQAYTQVDYYGDFMYSLLLMIPGIDYEPEYVLQTDFDNGGANTDGFGRFFGLHNLGTGDDTDGSLCFGDSGGSIINTQGEATGINSYIISFSYFGQTSDVTPGVADCSFGEFTGHTRISVHKPWIESIIGPIGDPPTDPPTDPITCGTGTTLNTSTNVCEADPQPSQCGTGTTLNTSTNVCEADPPTDPITCGTGTTLNTSTNMCELDAATTQILTDVNTLLTTNNCSPLATTIPDVLICIDDLIGPQLPPTDLTIDQNQSQLQMTKGGNASFTILGTGFDQGAVVTFEGGPKVPLAAVTSVSVDDTSMNIQVISPSSGPNKTHTYDLRVTLGTDTAVWSDALLVNPN